MSEKPIRILFIEDDPGNALLVFEMLNEGGLSKTEFRHVECMADAEKQLAMGGVDLILLDLGLPDAQGLGAVRRAQIAAPRVPLVVLTGLDDEFLATQALQEGAQDYLVKGQINARGLRRAMHYAVERKSTEEALYVEKERAQVSLNRIGDAVICTDISGNITFINLVAAKMTGWPRQGAAGKPLHEVYRVRDAAIHQATTNPAESTSGQNRIVPPPLTRFLVRPDGFEIPIEDSVSPIHNRAGEAT